MEEAPDNLMQVDFRDAEKLTAGNFKGMVNPTTFQAGDKNLLHRYRHQV